MILHSMLHRERPEKEYAPLYKRYGTSTTTWSSLASGLLTGKYNDGIPDGSRFDTGKDFFKDSLKSLNEAEGLEKIRKVKELTTIATGMVFFEMLTSIHAYRLSTELGTSMSALALAWVAKNPNTGTVILGATKPEQLVENLRALEVIPKLTPEVLEKIDAILNNKPAALVRPLSSYVEMRTFNASFSRRTAARLWIFPTGFKCRNV